MAPTLKDVARKAGVSLGTASKVLNNNPSVKADLRQRVAAAMQELDYLPNSIARSLKLSSSATLAVLVANLTNPFQMALAAGVEEVANAHGYSLVISSTNEAGDKERNSLSMFEQKRVDGIIVCPTGAADDKIAELVDRGVPIVIVDRPTALPNVDVVRDDVELGIELLVRHLYDLGHRRIGAIHGDQGMAHARFRRVALNRVFAALGLAVDDSLHISGKFSFAGSQAALRQIMASHRPPTAVVALNNIMCLGAIKAAKELGLSLPDELSIAALGDIGDAWEMISPRATEVSQSPREIGRWAAQRVLERIKDNRLPAVNKLIRPRLIVGQSTGKAQGSAAR